LNKIDKVKNFIFVKPSHQHTIQLQSFEICFFWLWNCFQNSLHSVFSSCDKVKFGWN